MKFKKQTRKVVTAFQAAVLLVMAAHSASAVGGYNEIAVLANSDAFISVPFTKTAEGAFTVSAVTGAVVTVSNTLTTDAYAPVDGNARYYVRLTGGTASEGLWSSISANGTHSFTLANATVAAKVSVGDTFTVYPHQTLASLFPAGREGVSFITAGDEGLDPAATVVLVKDTQVGTDKAASQVCSHLGQYGWYDGAGTPVNDLALEPGTFIQIRNADEAKALDIFVSGDVPDTKLASALVTSASDNDLYLVNPFPVDVRLGQLGLENWASSEDAATFGGLVLLYDNAAAGTDKSASTICFYLTGGDNNWYDGDGTNANSLVIPAGMGVVLRDSSGVPGNGVWTVNKPY